MRPVSAIRTLAHVTSSLDKSAWRKSRATAPCSVRLPVESVACVVLVDLALKEHFIAVFLVQRVDLH